MAKMKKYDTERMCGAKTDRGYNMSTASGLPFWPLDPRVEDVRITDIAAHLSRICRFNGALREGISMYSVAQHCYIISHKVPPKYALEGLLHDAAEAYVGDTIKPLKAFLPDMKLVEDAVDAVIREKFGLPETISPEVKKADYFAVATERRDVLPENLAVDWGSLPEPWPEKIVPVTPNRAQRLFLQRFEELYNGDS